MNPKQFIVFLNSIGAMLVEAANRVFTKSQRKTLTYADPKQAGALGDHPLGDKSGTFTLSQIFSVYSNGGEAGNPITLSVRQL